MGNIVLRRILTVLVAFSGGCALIVARSGSIADAGSGPHRAVDAAAVRPVLHAVHANHVLRPGERLVSPNGKYRALITNSNGRLVVLRSDGRWMWHTAATTHGAHLSVGAKGGVTIRAGKHNYWGTHTGGSGRHDILTLGNDGILRLTSGGLFVWSSKLGNGCRGAHGKTVRVDISEQLARMCNGGEQLRASYVTTGAVAKGLGTPTGTWHVQSRIRNTWLRPLGGGAYFVHYWMPYNGPYGLHDAPWQRFAYGSDLYKTRGSHGCVHFPEAVLRWVYRWASVGSTVTVHR